MNPTTTTDAEIAEIRPHLRPSELNVLFAMCVGFVFFSANSALADTAAPEDKARVIQVRAPGSRTVREGGPFVAALGDEVLVDVRSIHEFFQNLVDRKILPDPREPKILPRLSLRNSSRKRLQVFPRINKSRC
jgi:hypothetical protein